MKTLTIAITNQKGGVAKTTTAATLASALRRMGHKVLLVDMDPQKGSSSAWVLGTDEVPDSVYQVITGRVALDDAIISETDYDDISILPSDLSLASAEYQLASSVGKEYKLKESLEEAISYELYDFIIIDTPPALSFLTINALTAAEYVIIPTEANRFATDGIAQLSQTLAMVKKYNNPNISILGILLTQFDGNTTIAKEYRSMLCELEDVTHAKVFNTTIRKAVAMREAQAMNESIFSYAPKSTVGQDYAAFANEVVDILGVTDNGEI